MADLDDIRLVLADLIARLGPRLRQGEYIGGQLTSDEVDEFIDRILTEGKP